jgi:hypothetical protein
LVPRDRPSNTVQEGCRGASLHSEGEFDIIAGALQMTCSDRCSPTLSLLLAAALLTSAGVVARADDAPPVEARTEEEAAEAAATHKEITQALQDIQRKYGADAVMLEGHLLGHAIRGGSILEATVGVGGVEERDGKRFLAFKLETGIIYNDREIDAATRPVRVWTDVVEATLRKFRTMNVPADGIAVTLGYRHKPYGDEADLRAHLHESHGQAEAAAFYLLLSDVTELIAQRINSQQLIDRSIVLVDGAQTKINLSLLPTVAKEIESSGH